MLNYKLLTEVTAIEWALDDFVLVIDVDMVISPQLIPDLAYYSTYTMAFKRISIMCRSHPLHRHIRDDLNLEQKMVFVMPVFELSQRSPMTLTQSMPRDKRDFFRKFMDNELIPLRTLTLSLCLVLMSFSVVCLDEKDCEVCHNSTDYIKWFHSDRSYWVNYTLKYEPYKYLIFPMASITTPLGMSLESAVL